jgi:hypothetical protein
MDLTEPPPLLLREPRAAPVTLKPVRLLYQYLYAPHDVGISHIRSVPACVRKPAHERTLPLLSFFRLGQQRLRSAFHRV